MEKLRQVRAKRVPTKGLEEIYLWGEQNFW